MSWIDEAVAKRKLELEESQKLKLLKNQEQEKIDELWNVIIQRNSELPDIIRLCKFHIKDKNESYHVSHLGYSNNAKLLQYVTNNKSTYISIFSETLNIIYDTNKNCYWLNAMDTDFSVEFTFDKIDMLLKNVIMGYTDNNFNISDFIDEE